MSRVEVRLQRGVDHPAADLARRPRSARGHPRHPASPAGRRCAGARSLWAMKAWNASAVVAKPPGTETPRPASSPIISPSEEFLPPTWARSVRRRSCSHRMLALKTGTPGSMRWQTANRTGAGRSVYFSNPTTPALARHHHGAFRMVSSTRPVFYVSDGTGITAETIGHSLLTQFAGTRFATDRHSVRRHRRQGAWRRPMRSAAPARQHGDCVRSWSTPASTRNSMRCWRKAGR